MTQRKEKLKNARKILRDLVDILRSTKSQGVKSFMTME